MLKIKKRSDGLNSHIITPEYDTTQSIKVEIAVVSIHASEPAYYITMQGRTNAFITEEEMLELMAAFLSARKDWEDHNAKH